MLSPTTLGMPTAPVKTNQLCLEMKECLLAIGWQLASLQELVDTGVTGHQLALSETFQVKQSRVLNTVLLELYQLNLKAETLRLPEASELFVALETFLRHYLTHSHHSVTHMLKTIQRGLAWGDQLLNKLILGDALPSSGFRTFMYNLKAE